jgi:hypothetical protein
MTHVLTLKRRHEPEDPGAALAFFGLIAAAGFAVGWTVQLLGGF